MLLILLGLRAGLFLDEDEILIRQSQDRYFRKIDLLLAGERQQEIKGTLESLYIDDQRRVARRSLADEFSLECDFVRHHNTMPAAAPI